MYGTTRSPATLLLTGRPGVGKTTVIRKAVHLLGGLPLAGFTTEEIRSGTQRQGFRVATLDGIERVLAHVRIPKEHRVGRYGVDVGALDEIVERALSRDVHCDVYIIDEIGRMECLSPRFVGAVRELMAADRPVLATIAQRGAGFVLEVKRRPGVELWEVTRENRDGMPERVASWTRRVLASRNDAPGVEELSSSD